MKSMIDQKLEQDFNGTRGYNRNLSTLGNSGWQEEPICMKPQPHADEIAGSRNPTILWQLHCTALVVSFAHNHFELYFGRI